MPSRAPMPAVSIQPPRRAPAGRRARLALAGLSLAGAILVAWFVALGAHGHGYDAFAYWDVRLDDIYGRSLGQLTAFGAFRYSPPIAYLLAPLHLIPWPIFLVLWTGMLVAVLVWLTGRWALASCAYVGTAMCIYQGNIDLLIAASIVLGFRWPAAWSFAILTKATPIIGLIWYVARRDWRGLVAALTATLLVAIPTLVLVPDTWREYMLVLADNAETAEAGWLLIRLLLGGAIVMLAAWTNRPWLAAIAVAMVQPSLGLRSATVAVAAVALALRASDDRATEVAKPPTALTPEPTGAQ